MIEEAMQHLEAQRPSKDERFRGKIITQLTDTYRQQLRGDKPADRALIDAARSELQQSLDDGDTDKGTLFAGACLLLLIDDFTTIPEIMARYLALPLSQSERFWG